MGPKTIPVMKAGTAGVRAEVEIVVNAAYRSRLGTIVV